MSRRASTSTAPAPSSPLTGRESSSPYRRTSGPKTSRQQFSACGACRMRRVRCNLKDREVAEAGPNPCCSNCIERGLNCMYVFPVANLPNTMDLYASVSSNEYTEGKPVKSLRRGKRLQQVEAIYGKNKDAGQSHSPIIIPPLHSEFFISSFWTWFSIQRPVLDPVNYPSAFFLQGKKGSMLSPAETLITLALVTWAASFGLDERGMPLDDVSSSDTSPALHTRSHANNSVNTNEGTYTSTRQRTECMIQELLRLIDIHGLMRQPSWDGVRVLLLVVPLLQEYPLADRLTMQATAATQVQVLSAASMDIPLTSTDTRMRSRIIWYTYVQEGVTLGMRGCQMTLDDDVSLYIDSVSGKPGAETNPYSGVSTAGFNGKIAQTTSQQQTLFDDSPLALPRNLAEICRRVHCSLTGMKATRRIERSEGALVNVQEMEDIWNELERCWKDFEDARTCGSAGYNPLMEGFADGWRIFVFECHNVIREVLRHHAKNSAPSSPSGSHSPEQTSPHSGYLPAQQLHLVAECYCLNLLPQVVDIIKTNLYATRSEAGLFKWDAGLVRDGLFFAGVLSASVGDDIFHAQETTEEPMKAESHDMNPNQVLLATPVSGAENAVQICIAALEEMRWVYSKASEREETLKTIWQDMMYKRHGGNTGPFVLQPLPSPSPSDDACSAPAFQPPPLNFNYGALSAANTSHAARSSASSTHYLVPSPILIPPSSSQYSHLESGPMTSHSTDSSTASWLSYTPPDTGTTATSQSASASPVDSHFSSNAATVAHAPHHASPLNSGSMHMDSSNAVEFPEDATPYFQPPPTESGPMFSYNVPPLDTAAGYDPSSMVSHMPEDTYLDFGSGPTDTIATAQYHELGHSTGFYHE